MNTGTADVEDTFDDGPYTDGPDDSSSGDDTEMTSLGDGGDQDESEDSEEEQGSEEVSDKTEEPEDFDKDSQVNLLDEKEDTGAKKEEKDPDKGDEEPKSDDEDSKSESDEKDDVPKDDGSPAEEVRNIKAFKDGKAYEIPENAEIKVKVAGKSEKVSLSDLRDNYSGKVRYDEKFTELGDREKSFNTNKDGYEQEIGLVRNHLGNIANLVKGAMSGENSPTDGMEYLLDLMGGDTLQYKKAMFEHMAGDFDVYSQMTESERDSHWVKQENDYLTKKQESFQTNQKAAQTQAEHSQKVNSLREAHGISEEAYVSAKQDLEAEGVDNITPEKITQAARLTPLLETSEELMEPYLEQLTDVEANAMVVEIATTMLQTPTLTVPQIKQLLAEQYKVESLVTDLETKIGKQTSTNVAKIPKKTETLDTFDD